MASVRAWPLSAAARSLPAAVRVAASVCRRKAVVVTHAAPGQVPTLKKRAEFQRLAKGFRRSTRCFTLLAGSASGEFGRFGFTVTRKVGTATERNRIRRRLKAALSIRPSGLTPEIDAIIIARRDCLTQPFGQLRGDLAAEISVAHRKIAKNTVHELR